MTNRLTPFHLAIPVTDKLMAQEFYTNILGCSVGRQDDKWIDFNFFGHQLVAHLISEPILDDKTNSVDGEHVPSRHFGIIMQITDWEELIVHLKNKGISFYIKPQVRFKGNIGEQSTFFIKDPFGNALEFKAFKNQRRIFDI